MTATLTIYDTMKNIKADVSTICVGMAASGAAVILAAGAKGKRLALPNSEVMIHQLMGGAEGQATEIEITTRHMIKIKDRLNKILSECTGQPIKKVEADSDRDFYMDAEETKNTGMIDAVLKEKGLNFAYQTPPCHFFRRPSPITPKLSGRCRKEFPPPLCIFGQSLLTERLGRFKILAD